MGVESERGIVHGAGRQVGRKVTWKKEESREGGRLGGWDEQQPERVGRPTAVFHVRVGGQATWERRAPYCSLLCWC